MYKPLTILLLIIHAYAFNQKSNVNYFQRLKKEAKAPAILNKMDNLHHYKQRLDSVVYFDMDSLKTYVDKF